MILQELGSSIAGGTVLEITTTTGCIVGCSYCPQDKFAHRQRAVSHVKHLRLEDFKRCLARVPSSVDISFAGYSEPWLNPDCTEMVEHAYARGHGIRIFTTLVGMKGPDLHRLQALRSRVFVIHVLDDGAYMNSRLVGDNYLALIRQVVDTDIASIRFIVLGPSRYRRDNPRRRASSRAASEQQGWKRRSEDRRTTAASRRSADMC